MSPEHQTVLALTIVAVAAALLIRSAWKQRKAGMESGCSSGSGCGCPTRSAKAELVGKALRGKPE